MVIGIVIGIFLSLLASDISNLKLPSSSCEDMFKTYFDLNISGLEKDTPITYQGLEAGTVEDILIAPNKKYIEVHMMINFKKLKGFIAENLIAQVEISKKTVKMIVNLRPIAQVEITKNTGYILNLRSRVVDETILRPMFPTEYPIISSAPSKLP
jgi:hypothetical protein